MAVLKTALVLVHVVVTVLAWENIPAIPANRRAQYYLQHDDGGYKYGYDTGEGHSAQATADAANQVQGEYSYVDGEGQRVNWQYTAGDGGYVPVLRGSGAGGAVAKDTGFSSRAHSVHAGVNAASSGAGDADYDENADASYSFNIDTDSYKRTESADRKGNVQGRYSYNSPAGGSHAVSYVAGEGTGFVVTSDAASSAPAPEQAYLPPATPHDGQTQMGPDGSFSFAYTTGDHSHQATADAHNNVRGSYSFVSQDDGQTRKVDYHAGSATGFVARGAHLPVAPAVPAVPSSLGASSSHAVSAGTYSASRHNAAVEASDAKTTVNPDGSFSYSYSTGDHSRHESADAKNNVRGSFTFRSKDDGKTRKVDYVAGADTGFVATGDHLPVAPTPGGGAGFSSVASQAGASGHAAHSYSGSSAATSSSDAQSDGSYSFAYQTDDHSHHAAADSQGNVAGSFSYVAEDGVSRMIDYTAGADRGFVAKGAHLPVAPPVPAPAPGVLGVAPAAPSAGGGYQYSAPSSNAFSDDSQSNSDGSYSYNYDTGSSSKQESADAQGNVMGSFSFVAGDGVNRKLTYTARGEEGFIAHGDHLPVAPVAAPVHSSPNAFAHSDLFAGSAAAKSATSASDSGSVMASKEGAYSYSYKTGGHDSSASSVKSSLASQNSFGAARASPAGTTSHGAGTGHVMASKDGAYSYSYSTGGQSVAASKAASSHGAASTHSASGAGALSAGSQANDGSYSFSYDAGTHSHEQSADANNNVRGSFSFKAKDDGQVRKVDYTAGASTGFLAKGAHLPVAPAASGHASSAPSSFSAGSNIASGHHASEDSGDASYSYSYKTDSSSKEESSDAKGNVVGTFSFVGGDGVNRKLTYTARDEDGFIAVGDHLPVAPSVGGSSSQFNAHSASTSSAQSHRFSSTKSGTLPASTSHISRSDGNIVISRYLPPESPHKFGYIFDTKI